MDMDFTKEEQYAIVNVLAYIMEADTIIHPKEIEYIDSVMQEFNIIVQDNDHLESMDFDSCKVIIKCMNADKRQNAINMFINMSSIDGYVDNRETELINGLF